MRVKTYCLTVEYIDGAVTVVKIFEKLSWTALHNLKYWYNTKYEVTGMEVASYMES